MKEVNLSIIHNIDPPGYLEGAHPDNMTKLRITNNGLFDLHVDFVLKSKVRLSRVLRTTFL